MLRELIKLTESPRGQLAAKTPEQLAQIRAAAAEKRAAPVEDGRAAISSGAQADGAGITMRSGADESRRRELDRREGVRSVQQDI